MAAKLRAGWKRIVLWLVIGLVYALPLVTVRGAFDMFIKIDGVDGESTDAKHKGWIEVQSFQHGVSQPPGGAAGGARSAGRANHQDFTVVKALDKASPKLLLSCCSGKHIPTVTVEFFRPVGDKGEKQKFMQYKLSDVIVASVKPQGVAGGSPDRPTEEVSFNYGKIEWTYTGYETNGVPTGDVRANWDLLYDKGY